MVKSARSRQEEEMEEETDDYEDLGPRTDSSSFKVDLLKADERSREQKVNTHRSKHSETEQRRRSKINERFQILRDLIPPNDQKRDKASFLLEVIEYIQFLQEKLQVYEGTYAGWNQESTKLIPWSDHNGSAQSLMDHFHVNKNSSNQGNNIISAMQPSSQNPLESDVEIYRELDRPSGPSTPAVHHNVFTPVRRDIVYTKPLQESISDAENMACEPQSELLNGKPGPRECAVPNNTSNEQELTVESGLVDISSSYSRGVLNFLTQALGSLGVDLSQTNIAVQIDVGKRSNSRLNDTTSSSKDLEKQYSDDQVMAKSGAGNDFEDSGQSHKRPRKENS